MGSQRVRHDWMTEQQQHWCILLYKLHGYNNIFLFLYTLQHATTKDLVSICHQMWIAFAHFTPAPLPLPSSLLLCCLYLRVCVCFVLFVPLFIYFVVGSHLYQAYESILSFQPQVGIPALPRSCPSHTGLRLSFSSPCALS